MEIAEQSTIPFVGINITKSGNKLETSVFRKPTNTGLLLYYHSHGGIWGLYGDFATNFCPRGGGNMGT